MKNRNIQILVLHFFRLNKNWTTFQKKVETIKLSTKKWLLLMN